MDRAFELEGFCVVRGPDLLWGGDIRSFHPPAGVFDGVIGGPPCQAFSRLRWLNEGKPGHQQNLIPEFERVVAESQPQWFVMENVPAAPYPTVDGYHVDPVQLDNLWVGGEQRRRRMFCFGWRGDDCHGLYGHIYPELVALYATGSPAAVVTSSDGSGKVKMSRYSLPEACLLQGLPDDFLDGAPFTADGKLKAVANGVPLPMGRAIARAVKRALAQQQPQGGARRAVGVEG